MTAAPTPADPAAELPGHEAGPLFAEPWQARIFALVAQMCADGRYAWDDFKELLIEEIGANGGPDGRDYYERWLAACERLIARRGFVAFDELARRKRELADHPPHPTAAPPGPIAVDPARKA